MGGLAESSREWYIQNILKVLKKHKKASLPLIMAELKMIPQNRMPITKDRIIAFLKYLRATGQVRYTYSEKRAIASKWEIDE